MRKAKQNIMYRNEKQLDFLKAQQRMKLFLAGRGTGKTYCLGDSQYKSLYSFPGAKSFISSSTYAQILTKTLPEVQQVWAQYGLKEGLHYVIGIRPPKSFKKPIAAPKLYKNVISFASGYHIDLLSMDRPDLSRGGSYISGDVDEALNVKQDAVTKVIIPSMRGYRTTYCKRTKMFYGKKKGYRQLRFYSSIPRKPSGYWLMDWKDLAKKHPELYALVEACTMDNIAVLGLDFIEDMKRTLPPIEFQIEILNIFLGQIPDGYYRILQSEKAQKNIIKNKIHKKPITSFITN